MSCGKEDQVIVSIWQSSEEYSFLTSCYKQGILGEIASLSTLDNPHPWMSIEWIYWDNGFDFAINEKFNKIEA